MRTRTRFTLYPAWAYQREAADNDALSRQGWQLVRCGCLTSKYVFDNSVQYRYALDFDQNIADPGRYRDTFAEQGWEFINDTFNGWHCFRKKYDPALPEEEYHIYTDGASIRQMEDRWRRMLSIIGWIELAVGLLDLAMLRNGFYLSNLLIGLGSVLLGAAILLGARRGKRESLFLVSGWVLVPALVCFFAALITTFTGH